MPASKKVKLSVPKENRSSEKPEPQEVKQKVPRVRRSRSLSAKRVTSDSNDVTPEIKDTEENSSENVKTTGKKASRKFSSSAFKTPASKPMSEMNYAPITPKFKRDTSLTILRRPKDGERVVSMQGSPLLVSAVVEEKSVNVNLPMKNGNMMSMLPMEGFRKSHIPKLDKNVKEQLAMIKKQIELVLHDDQ